MHFCINGAKAGINNEKMQRFQCAIRSFCKAVVRILSARILQKSAELGNPNYFTETLPETDFVQIRLGIRMH